MCPLKGYGVTGWDFRGSQGIPIWTFLQFLDQNWTCSGPSKIPISHPITLKFFCWRILTAIQPYFKRTGIENCDPIQPGKAKRLNIEYFDKYHVVDITN